MKKVVLLGSVIAVLGLAPLGIKAMSDKLIDNKSKELKTHGIELNITNESGYLETKRDFDLIIKDADKFQEYLKSQLKQSYPAYIQLYEAVSKKDAKEINDFLEGLVFKGDIHNSNINLSSDIETNIALHKFSKKIMDKIKSGEKEKAFFIPMLENKELSVNILFSNEGKIKTTKLKDINKSFDFMDKKGQKVSTNILLQGYEVQNKSKNDLVIADSKLDKFAINLAGAEKGVFELNKINYDLNYKNQLENSGEFKINSIMAKAPDMNFNINDIAIKSMGEANGELYKAFTNFSANKLKVLDKSQNLFLEKFNFDLSFDEVSYLRLEELRSSYMQFEASAYDISLTKKQRDQIVANSSAKMVDSFIKVLNDGFNIKLNANLEDLKSPAVNLKDLKVDVDATLAQNDIALASLNQQEVLNSISATANILMPKSDLESLLRTMKPNMAMMVSMYAKEQKDNVVFDITLSAGKIKINGQNLN